MTPAIHSFHAAALPMLESFRSRLPVADQASARISTDCSPDADHLCGILMTVRPEELDQTLVLSIVLAVWDGRLELDVVIQDLNNYHYGPFDLLRPVSDQVTADSDAAVRAVEAALPGWVASLLPLLDRERVYAALPFAPDGLFRSQSVAWFDLAHAALGGRTPAQAIVDGDLVRVVEVASAERA